MFCLMVGCHFEGCLSSSYLGPGSLSWQLFYVLMSYTCINKFIDVFISWTCVSKFMNLRKFPWHFNSGWMFIHSSWNWNVGSKDSYISISGYEPTLFDLFTIVTWIKGNHVVSSKYNFDQSYIPVLFFLLTMLEKGNENQFSNFLSGACL